MTTNELAAVILVVNAVFLVCMPVLHDAVLRWRNRR